MPDGSDTDSSPDQREVQHIDRIDDTATASHPLLSSPPPATTPTSTHIDPAEDSSVDHGWPWRDVLLDTTYVSAQPDAEDLEAKLDALSPEVRRSVALLLVHALKGRANTALVHAALRDVCGKGHENALTAPHTEVEDIAKQIPSNLRLGILVGIVAAHMKASGRYDARVRWAVHRMACILEVPWEKVVAGEKVLAAALLEKAKTKSAKGKTSAFRWVKIGAGVTIGAGVLVVTGGLAAPLVAAAATAVASAAGGAAAAAGLTTVATAIAATAAQLSVVMSVPVITAIFGTAGAGVAGAKVYKRTSGVDEVTYTNVREDLLSLPPWVLENPCDTFAYARGAKGLVVPLGTRPLVQSNFEKKLASMTKKVVLCFDYALPPADGGVGGSEDGALYLLESHIETGEWVYSPPEVVKKGQSAVFAAKRCGFGASVSGCVVYGSAVTGGSKVVLVFTSTIMGPTIFKVGVLSAAEVAAIRDAGDDDAALIFQDVMSRDMADVLSEIGMLDGSSNKDIAINSVTSSSDSAVFSIKTEDLTPPLCFLPQDCAAQRTTIHNEVSKSRKHVTLTFDNMTSHPLHVLDVWATSGMLAEGYPFPEVIPPGHCFVGGAQTTKMALKARGYALFCTFAPGSTGQMNAVFLVCAFSSDGDVASRILLDKPTRTDCAKLARSEEPEDSLIDDNPVDNSCSAFTSSAEASANNTHVRYQLRSVGSNFDLREEAAMEGLDVTIGVSGMTPHYDPRVGVEELQGLLWGSVLGGAGWFVRWEAELQAELGEYMSTPTDYGSPASGAAQRGTAETLKNPTVAASTGHAGTTVLAATSLLTAIALPLYAYQASGLIDHSYSLLNVKAKQAGKLLAEMLLEHTQGKRPATLVGSSLGANVIYYALQHLHEAGEDGKGLIEHAYLIGGTMSCNPIKWGNCREVVAGRVVNLYSGKDWMMRLMHSGLTASVKTPAGLGKVTNVQGIENVDIGHLAASSIDYATRIKDILEYLPAYPTARTLSTTEWYPASILPTPILSKEVDIMKECCCETMFFVCAIVNRLDGAIINLCDSSLTSGEWSYKPSENRDTNSIPFKHAASLAITGRGAVVTLLFSVSPADGRSFTPYNFLFKAQLPLIKGSVEAAAQLCYGKELDGAEDELDKTLSMEGSLDNRDGVVLKVNTVTERVFVTLADAVEEEHPEEEESEVGEVKGRCPAEYVAALLSRHRFVEDACAAVVVRNRTASPIIYCWASLRRCSFEVRAVPLEIPANSAALLFLSDTASLFARRPQGALCFTDAKRSFTFAFEAASTLSSAKIVAECSTMDKATEENAKALLMKSRSDGYYEQIPASEGCAALTIAAKIKILELPVFFFTLEQESEKEGSSSAAPVSST